MSIIPEGGCPVCKSNEVFVTAVDPNNPLKGNRPECTKCGWHPEDQDDEGHTVSFSLDALDSLEKNALIEAFLDGGGPMNFLVRAAKIAVKDGASPDSVIEELKGLPQYTLFWKLCDAGIVDFDYTEEQFSDEVLSGLKDDN